MKGFFHFKRLAAELRQPSKTANERRLWEVGEILNSFEIREARPDDMPGLAQLHVTTFNATHHAFPIHRRPSLALREQQWGQWLTTIDRGYFCYVVENEDHTLVGFTNGLPGDYPGFAGHLDKIYLLRHYQRLGLGRRLMGHACRRFLTEGIHSMMLFSQAENPSCKFFEALQGERLLSETGEFHGAYGWHDLKQLVNACPIES